jgi:hypothetical protein
MMPEMIMEDVDVECSGKELEYVAEEMVEVGKSTCGHFIGRTLEYKKIH